MKLELYKEKTLDEYIKYVKETIEIRYAFEPLDSLTVTSIWDYLNWKLSIGESKIIKNYTIGWTQDESIFSIVLEHVNGDAKQYQWHLGE